jgi:hypothetical protein
LLPPFRIDLDVYDFSTPETAAEVGTIQASDPDGDYLNFVSARSLSPVWCSQGKE